MLVRPARPNDLVSLLVLLREFGGVPAPGRTAAEPADGDRAREILASVLEQRGRTLLVADRDGEIVGTADLLIVPNLMRRGAPWAILENVVANRQASDPGARTGDRPGGRTVRPPGGRRRSGIDRNRATRQASGVGAEVRGWPPPVQSPPIGWAEPSVVRAAEQYGRGGQKPEWLRSRRRGRSLSTPERGSQRCPATC